MTVAFDLDEHIHLAITIGDCIPDLEIIAKASEPEDLVNRVQYLPL